MVSELLDVFCANDCEEISVNFCNPLKRKMVEVGDSDLISSGRDGDIAGVGRLKVDFVNILSVK